MKHEKLTDPNKPVIISVGVGAWHPRGIDRLLESLFGVEYEGDYCLWKDEYPQNSPTHQEVSYAFKPYAFRHLKNLGYKKVFWVDSSMWAVRNPERLFKDMDEIGYLFVNGGWSTGQWCSDNVMKLFGYSRTQLFEMGHLVGGYLGLNFEYLRSCEFFDQWFAHIPLGFNGPWSNKNGECSSNPLVLGHRHDQTIASIVSTKLNMLNWLTPDQAGFQYKYEGQNTKDSTIFLAQGM